MNIIEIIVSLVLLSIFLVELPVIVTGSIKSIRLINYDRYYINGNNLLDSVFTRFFDENNTINDNYLKSLQNQSYTESLIIPRKGKTALGNKQRKGTLNYSNSKIGKDSNENSLEEYDDIDDFNNYSKSTGKINYKINVSYFQDKFTYKNHICIFDTSKNEITNKKTNIKIVNLIIKDKNKKFYIKRIGTNIGNIKYYSNNLN